MMVATIDSHASASTEFTPDVDDDRGAVMLLGLFMSIFLIGSLWFIIGIGDTIVFRNKMQEAADHGAFASAALHAKGMNFISLCNLLILAAVVIHLILGIITDIHLAIAIVACLTLVGCVPAAKKYGEMKQRWSSYFNKMKPAVKAVHKAQVVASYGYPAMGLIEAGQIGATYKSRSGSTPFVLALSTSLIPGTGPIMKMLGNTPKPGEKATATQAIGGSMLKYGLPVEARPFSNHCKKIVKVGFNTLVGLTGISPTGHVMDLLKELIANAFEWRYCNKVQGIDPGNDPFWDENGGMAVYGAASNGSMWMQTWAINILPELRDESEARVGFAAKKFERYTKTESPGAYLAQAEFYFDCDDTWATPGCNYEENATYQIKWRARMRRLQAPAIASGLFGMVFQMLLNQPAYANFKAKLATKIGGENTFLESQIKAAITRITATVHGEIGKAGGGAAAGLDPQVGGIYH